MLYGLLVLDSGNPDSEHLFHLIVVAISLSIVAHSSTDVPIASYFGRVTTAQHKTSTEADSPSIAPSEPRQSD